MSLFNSLSNSNRKIIPGFDYQYDLDNDVNILPKNEKPKPDYKKTKLERLKKGNKNTHRQLC